MNFEKLLDLNWQVFKNPQFQSVLIIFKFVHLDLLLSLLCYLNFFYSFSFERLVFNYCYRILLKFVSQLGAYGTTLIFFKNFLVKLIENLSKSYLVVCLVCLMSVLYEIFFRVLADERFLTVVSTTLTTWSHGIYLTTPDRAIWLHIRVPQEQIAAGIDDSLGFTQALSLDQLH